MRAGGGQVFGAAADRMHRGDMAAVIQFGRGDAHHPAIDALRPGEQDHQPGQYLHRAIEALDGKGGEIGEMDGRGFFGAIAVLEILFHEIGHDGDRLAAGAAVMWQSP